MKRIHAVCVGGRVAVQSGGGTEAPDLIYSLLPGNCYIINIIFSLPN